MQNQKQKILEFLRFQHLIALHIIKHHQHKMLILWSNVKKSWKTLFSKLTEAIRSYIHCMHVCKIKNKFCFLCSPWPISINPKHIWIQNKDSKFQFLSAVIFHFHQPRPFVIMKSYVIVEFCWGPFVEAQWKEKPNDEGHKELTV